MKATRIVDCVGPNPGFSQAAKNAAIAAGEPYDVPETIDYKTGSINEHPDCWMLCVMSEPMCAPLDDECKKKVQQFLESPKRKSQLAKLRELCVPEVFAKLPKGMQTYVRTVVPKWLKDVKIPAEATAASSGSTAGTGNAGSSTAKK